MLLINFVRSLFILTMLALIFAVMFFDLGWIITGVTIVVVLTLGQTLDNLAEEWLVERFNRKL